MTKHISGARHVNTFLCQHGNCQIEGPADEMIVVSGGGFRDRYCSWTHAALGCLHRMNWHNQIRDKFPQIAQAEELLKKVGGIS